MPDINIEQYVDYLDEQIKFHGMELEKHMNAREIMTRQIKRLQSLHRETTPKLDKPKRVLRGSNAPPERNWRRFVDEALSSGEWMVLDEIVAAIGSKEADAVHRITSTLWAMSSKKEVQREPADSGDKRNKWKYKQAAKAA